MTIMSRLALACAAVLIGGLLAGCGFRTAGPKTIGSASGWIEQPVSFRAGGMIVYGTYRHPRGNGTQVPAALLIAGSGPTDRNGNNPAIPGAANTLQTLAHWLSADGVASLRYDKLGSGQTGLGPYSARPQAIGPGAFERQAAAALTYLAARPGVDAHRLTVIGHSEGALFALLLATGRSGRVPPIRALGLIEPLSRRYLAVINQQVQAQVASAQKSGQLTATQARRTRSALAESIASLRRSSTVPDNLPPGLASLFNPSAIRFLAQADRYDPAGLAAHLAAHLPVLVTCSDSDTQVSCDDVHRLVAPLAQSRTETTVIRLTGVDHVLKQDPSRNAAKYGADLPFSPQLQRALRRFATANR